ncbi:uncharacterized protein YlbG (UPF0298 family) [Weissella beninensis]|uniref:YlbG family protein n=1 Tax=Periweissella beninensis TaxID=504936 RepID=A0ABT0VIE0_9LACO|nr:YlbG family protein [Periweissella beninensis]MBM7544201.1 uncharacterized protein YlbG (UPF0298 family) [Periweissella beninensis]MCM2437591.1 YlbG family protein [Periweissella beninensis]
MAEFSIEKRRAIYVYLRSLRQVKQLRKYGQVEFTSRKMHYILLYMDADLIEETKDKLIKLGFVIRIKDAIRSNLNANLNEKNEDNGFTMANDEVNDLLDEGVEL